MRLKICSHLILNLTLPNQWQTWWCTNQLPVQLHVKCSCLSCQHVMDLLAWYVQGSWLVTSSTSMVWCFLFLHLHKDLCLAHFSLQPVFPRCSSQTANLDICLNLHNEALRAEPALSNKAIIFSSDNRLKGKEWESGNSCTCIEGLTNGQGSFSWTR